jgi:hypothetical protein
MDSNLWYGGTKARDFWSTPGIASVFNLRRGLCSKVPPSPIEMRPAEWSGGASQGSGVVWSRCFSASRCASSSFLSVNLAPEYWHQNGGHRHSGRLLRPQHPVNQLGSSHIAP